MFVMGHAGTSGNVRLLFVIVIYSVIHSCKKENIHLTVLYSKITYNVIFIFFGCFALYFNCIAN